MFEWSNSHSVGVHGIDAQHKNLFRLAADLQRAIAAGKTQAIPPILDRLMQLTAIHFAYEERLIQEAGYPEFETHKLEHDELKRKALQYLDDFKKGNAIAFELLRFLNDAIQQHVLESDQKYARYLATKTATQ